LELIPPGQRILNMVADGSISSAEALKMLAKAHYRLPLEREREGAREALAELEGLVGLQHVKALVRELCAFIEVQRMRREKGLAAEPLVLHMIFRGNPGTGKTTVARLLGKIFRGLGVLEKGHVVEVERADLVGEYIGHTAQRTRECILRAKGGILFIDEAYSLARGGEKDFGKEAIDTLVKSMEDRKNDFVLILAGYLAEMEWFLKTNPGLRSRFPIQLDFPDYDHNELLSIAEQILEQRQYTLTPQARKLLSNLLKRPEHSNGNARTVRNLIERAIRRQAVRLMSLDDISTDALQLLAAGDLEVEWQ